MLKLPLVSFVVTSFNYEKYLSKTLDSIKSQTYRNFEVIIVDDCSTDNSYLLAEKFVAENQDLKITLVKQEKNSGQLAGMIKGLELAQGQFVSFIDSDDVLLPDYAKAHIRVHLETSVALTSCQIVEIGDEDEVHTMNSISSPHCESLDELFAGEDAKFKILKHKRFGGWYWSPNSSAMFRKSAIELIKDYKNVDAWRICPDKFLFNFAHLIGGSAIIYTPLIGYRRHSGNAGDCRLVTGDKRLHSDYITKINLKNNLKIRPEMIKFLWQERKVLGLRNTISLLLKILV